jgi:hypothetical protein
MLLYSELRANISIIPVIERHSKSSNHVMDPGMESQCAREREWARANPGLAFRLDSETAATRPLHSPSHYFYVPRHAHFCGSLFDACNTLQIVTLASSADIELHSMPDAATEPLIADEREVPSDPESEDLREDEEVDESKLVAPGAFIWGLTICAGVSGLLFGYE